MSAATQAAWLRSMSEKGGKGCVNNIDARSLGRVADTIDRLTKERDEAVKALRPFAAQVDDQGNVVSKLITDDDMRFARATLKKLGEHGRAPECRGEKK